MIRVFLLIILLCNLALAYKCHYGVRCQDSRIGLGGYYTHLNSPRVSTHNGGGFLTLQEDLYWRWFYLGGELSAGVGGSSMSGIASASGNYESISDRNWFALVTINAGANLGSLEKPTFLYMSFSTDLYDVGFENNRGRFRDFGLFLGVGAFHRIMLTDKLALEPRANIAWNATRRLAGYGYNVRSDKLAGAFDGSYKAELSLGILYRGNAYNSVEDLGEVLAQKSRYEMPDFYARIKGMYYHMNALTMPYLDTQTIHHPEANNFVLMLEFGIGLNAPFN